MIRRRLVLAVVGVFVVAIVAAGLGAVLALRSRLIADVDASLEQRRNVAQDRAAALPFSLLRDDAPPAPGFLTESDMAVIAITLSGEILFSQPAGSSESPDPLPDIDAFALEQLRAGGPPLTLDGEFPHRAVGISLDEGSVLVLSIPLEGVRDTVTSTISILLWSGLAAAVAVGALVWWIIRGALRPIGAMADTADLINDGDLSQRVGVDVPGDEVGRLGTAFNSMLGRIEEAVDARTESEATMRQFVADASHELRTPLTSIRGYAELHRAGATSPEHVERAFQRIEHEARRMGVLVDDLVLLARLDEARPLSNVEVDLAGVVEEAVTGARAVEPGRSISIRGTHGDYRVAGDPDRLRQVIDNLLGNVRAHTPAESTVEVGLERRGDDVAISVSDNGPGMGEDAADRAFERFFQEGDDRSTPGSGLGLAIVRSIVEAHHRSVELESQSGRGTTVTVILPSL